MSILLNGEVRSGSGGEREAEEGKGGGDLQADQSLVWSGEWYFAKNQMNSKEFHYRRVSDSVPKNIVDYVSFTASSSAPKPGRGRKKSKSKDISSEPLPPAPAAPATPEPRLSCLPSRPSGLRLIESSVTATLPCIPQEKVLLQVRIWR